MKLKRQLFPITHFSVLNTRYGQIPFSNLYLSNACKNKNTQGNIFHEYLVGIKLGSFTIFFLFFSFSFHDYISERFPNNIKITLCNIAYQTPLNKIQWLRHDCRLKKSQHLSRAAAKITKKVVISSKIYLYFIIYH